MKHLDVPKVSLYCKGHSVANVIGAWAFVLTMPDKYLARRNDCGTKDKASHNEMEILAATNGLALLKRPCHVTLFSNSAYLLGGVMELIEGRIYPTNTFAWEAFAHAAQDHLFECTHIKKLENTGEMRIVDSMAFNLLPPELRRGTG